MNWYYFQFTFSCNLESHLPAARKAAHPAHLPLCCSHCLLPFLRTLCQLTHNKSSNLACSRFWLAHTLCAACSTAQPSTWLGPTGAFRVQVKVRHRTDVTCSATTFVSPSHELQECHSAGQLQATSSVGISPTFKNHTTPFLDFLLV